MTKTKPSFKEAFQFWLKLGFISFGGPAGQIAIMHQYLVEKKKWISDSKFLHALNYCMILPGPEAQQLAIYIGWLLHGIKGGLTAGILFVLPSVFILAGLSSVYVLYGNIPWVYALFAGLKPAVVAIVVYALTKIAKKSLLSSFHYLIAVLAFICIFFFNIPFPLIIIGAVLLGLVIQKTYPAMFGKSSEESAHAKNNNEQEYYINKNTVVENIGFKPLRFWKQVFIGIVLWCVPFLIFYWLTADFIFWKTLSLFFTKAALVTFGGAYAVLPYVAQVSVEKFNWLSSMQMMDGLALGETTPGPLIMVLAFVGFMAGYNHFEHSLLMGIVGLLTTTFFTFLPCFLFIFIGAPVIERTHNNKKLKQLLSIITAAVVGVVANLGIYLGKAVVFPQGMFLSQINILSSVWIIISFIALYKYNINMMKWIAISAVYGLFCFLIR